MVHTHHAPPAVTPTLTRQNTGASTRSTFCVPLQARYERVHDDVAGGLFLSERM